jgi:hypothetical protein
MPQGEGTKESPWVLMTPPGTSEYQMYKDESADPPALVCVVGKTTLGYQLRALDDLHAMLKEHGDWMLLAAPTSRSRPPKAPSRPGRDLPTTRSGLIRAQEGAARALRHVRPAADGSPGPGRARTPPAQQPHAGSLTLGR